MTGDATSRASRLSGLPGPDTFRSAYERDRDRMLYASAFRRLAGITQVAAAGELQLLHNRLTHSLKVDQVGAALCNALPDALVQAMDIQKQVVSTASLAHDLGHPPFGHAAESVLHHRLSNWGGFEGNAQSFRIVTKLSVHSEGLRGLDLTRGSLCAILKYPQMAPPSPQPLWTDRWQGSKWGVYPSEYDVFTKARQDLQPNRRSAEALLMDWADDVAYATHDIDDYVRNGLIPLERIRDDIAHIAVYTATRLQKKYPNDFAMDMLSDAESILLTLPTEPYRGRIQDRVRLHKWVSETINRCIGALTVLDAKPYLAVDAAVQYEVELLKSLTGFYVIDSPRLSVGQMGQTAMIEGLFDILCSWMDENPGSARLPVWLRELYRLFLTDPGRGNFDNSVRDGRERERNAQEAAGVREQDRTQLWVDADSQRLAVRRAVCDFMCSLTEGQAADLHSRLAGYQLTHNFGSWVL